MKTGLMDDQLPKLDLLNKKYSNKVSTPIYEPKRTLPPRIHELCNIGKSNKLIREIHRSGVTEKEKLFLIEAAKRHTVFNYSNIAEYYCHAVPEMQGLMEKSALVILDFERAIELGYVKLSENIADAYLNDYGDDEHE